MTEEFLHTFVERLRDDAGFRGRLRRDVTTALAELDLSVPEQAALTSNDEDALRRLPGAAIQDASPAKCFWSWVTRHICTWIFCGPPGTRDWQCPKKP